MVTSMALGGGFGPQESPGRNEAGGPGSAPYSANQSHDEHVLETKLKIIEILHVSQFCHHVQPHIRTFLQTSLLCRSQTACRYAFP